jgi:hypothetical protein
LGDVKGKAQINTDHGTPMERHGEREEGRDGGEGEGERGRGGEEGRGEG